MSKVIKRLMFSKLLGDPNSRKIKRYSPIVTDINLFEEDLLGLSDDQLRSKTIEFKEKIDKVTSFEQQILLLDNLLPEAFAVVREASKRVLGMRHFDVQLLG